MIMYKPLQHIRAITFDLDDTLYDNEAYIAGAEKALLQYIDRKYPIAAQISKKQWAKIKQQILALQPELMHDLAALRTSVLTEGFVMVGMSSDKSALAASKCFDHFYKKRSDFKVEKPERSLLKKLAEKVPIAAISNGNVNCKAIGIEKYFSHIVQASNQFPMKPDRSMFDHIAQMFNIPAKNILHVGDDLDKDVKGAIDAGYQSAWYAANRQMSLGSEAVSVLPHVQLRDLNDLRKLIKQRKA